MTHLSVWRAGGGIEEAGTVVCVEEESMVVVDLNDEDCVVSGVAGVSVDGGGTSGILPQNVPLMSLFLVVATPGSGRRGRWRINNS